MPTILTVNSSASIRHKMVFALKSAGYHVIEAVDGDDALYKAKWSHPDAVLTDINLPKMDGIALIEKLRKISNYQQTPMLMLTNESPDKIKDYKKYSGATDLLVKPFKAEQLLATIKKLLPEDEQKKINNNLSSKVELTH
jgi:two-component system, chemotaxis family, chemotaxis protein CheY